jgi:cytochrome c peroxidase
LRRWSHEQVDPPARKLTVLGRLDPTKATEEERLGEQVFFGKGQCGVCHPAPFYLGNLMARALLYAADHQCGVDSCRAIKTFTLRGIKDSPPYLHDGRLLTLEDTVEFFNLVLGVQLTPREKAALVAFMRRL